MKREIAMILPPREGFSPHAVGAIGLLVHRLAAQQGEFSPFVVGMAQAAPFADVAFMGVTPSWMPGRLAMRYARGVAKILRRRRPAGIEVHNRPDVALFLAERFADIPVCLFLHNDPQGMRGAKTARERAALTGRLARVVTVSAYLRARFGAGLAVDVLPNCLDLAEIPGVSESRAAEILFAGRVVADKGADSFVAACALALPRLAGWHATIIGGDRFDPDNPQTPFLRALTPQARAAGVDMMGYQPHATVLAAMAQAAIVVVPSRWGEPFGLTALEAMAAGAALLCSQRGGLAEVTGDAAVAIDPEDPQGMADAMVALARDPARQAALGQAGRARAAQFDVRIVGRALDALRSDVLGAWSARPVRPI